MKLLGAVRDYDDLHAILRKRASALQLTREGLDEVCGFTRSHASKLLAPAQTRKPNSRTLGTLLEALGVKLFALVDDEAMAAHATRREMHRAMKPVRFSDDAAAVPIPHEIIERAARELLRAQCSQAGRKGGLARVRRQSPEQRRAAASRAARARWSRMTPEERRKELAQVSACRGHAERTRHGRKKRTRQT